MVAAVRRIIDHVVDQLEGDAEVAAKAVERVLGFLAGFGDDRRDPAGGGEQRGGLGRDDRRDIGPRRYRSGAARSVASTSPSAITADAWLRILSTLRLPSSTISSNARLNRKSPTSTLAGLPQMRLAVRLPRRGSGAVDDIVVEQGRGVDELDRGGELVVAAAGIAEQAARRPESASAACACRRRRSGGRRARGSARPCTACDRG